MDALILPVFVRRGAEFVNTHTLACVCTVPVWRTRFCIKGSGYYNCYFITAIAAARTTPTLIGASNDVILHNIYKEEQTQGVSPWLSLLVFSPNCLL